ncbi:VanZ family protein [Xanthobacter versatilis]|uniref:VanZ family protein n=1 Tax=Xanthobacter autotrophicus (strain ATCC BAA-1158 / Py2) TaxID=78245 RepID=UPI0037286D14
MTTFVMALRTLLRHKDRVLKGLAAVLWLVIVILSLLPGSERPHTGYSGNLEHFVAYLGTGAVTAFAFPAASLLRLALPFVLASGLFEIAQIFIPGRLPGVDNWMASSLGAFVGILAMRTVVAPLLMRWRRKT